VGLRDEIETVIRAWNAYEIGRGLNPVVDYDCHPIPDQPEPAGNRLAVYRHLTELRQDATGPLATRLDADLSYLGALLGERTQLADYVKATRGCGVAGWPEEYITACGDTARKALDAIGIAWGPDTAAELNRLEEPLPVEEAPDAIRQAAADYEPAVRHATGTTAPYELTIETAKVDAYWAYWVDGAGPRVRLRLNLPNVSFTKIAARQFALHEVLGHGLQGASYSAHAASEEVPWVRLLSVHAPQQVLLEGLAQALPLFIAPDDELLIARVRLVHYTQLVRGELHLAINNGTPVLDCAERTRARAPFYTDSTISGLLADRSANVQLRSYQWSYPAGIDWFANLAEAEPNTIRAVLHAAYLDPLMPSDLTSLWPTGPEIGGPGK
jgi:hypothetical protein